MPLSEHGFQATKIAHELFDKNSLLDLIPPRELFDLSDFLLEACSIDKCKCVKGSQFSSLFCPSLSSKKCYSEARAKDVFKL